jgi:hypothetical protein
MKNIRTVIIVVIILFALFFGLSYFSTRQTCQLPSGPLQIREILLTPELYDGKQVCAKGYLICCEFWGMSSSYALYYNVIEIGPNQYTRPSDQDPVGVYYPSTLNPDPFVSFSYKEGNLTAIKPYLQVVVMGIFRIQHATDSPEYAIEATGILPS